MRLSRRLARAAKWGLALQIYLWAAVAWADALIQ